MRTWIFMNVCLTFDSHQGVWALLSTGLGPKEVMGGAFYEGQLLALNYDNYKLETKHWHSRTK